MFVLMHRPSNMSQQLLNKATVEIYDKLSIHIYIYIERESNRIIIRLLYIYSNKITSSKLDNSKDISFISEIVLQIIIRED